MSEQRVGDVVVGVLAEGGVLAKPNIVRDLALDLRATRARLAALEPVVRVAVRLLAAFPIIGSPLDTRQEDVVRSLDAAVGALPEALRKEFGA